MTSSAKQFEHSVFINCPFDADYANLFRAAVFAIVDCGFNPRSALDVSDASEVRIHKIYAIVGACRLGLHDLSRTQLDAGTGLPRFNMPLELGIFLGAKFLGDSKQRRKGCLVFDEKPYRYQMYLSDVAGQDISWHANDPKILVLRVRDWLASLSGEALPSGSVIWDHFTTFKGELRHSCERVRQRPEELTHLDFLRHVRSFKEAYFENLNIQGTKAVPNPSLEKIRSAIRRMRPGNDAFVILEKGANGLSYLQAILNDDQTWDVEYQDGHLDEHYRSTLPRDTDSVIRALQAYARGEDTWRSGTTWERQEI